MTTTPPPGPTCTPQKGFEFDPRLAAATLKALAASREDSHPQDILKFHRPSSLDYRARQTPLINAIPWHLVSLFTGCVIIFILLVPNTIGGQIQNLHSVIMDSPDLNPMLLNFGIKSTGI